MVLTQAGIRPATVKAPYLFLNIGVAQGDISNIAEHYFHHDNDQRLKIGQSMVEESFNHIKALLQFRVLGDLLGIFDIDLRCCT